MNLYKFVGSSSAQFLLGVSRCNQPPPPNDFTIIKNISCKRLDNIFFARWRMMKTIGFFGKSVLCFSFCIVTVPTETFDQNRINCFISSRISLFSKAYTKKFTTELKKRNNLDVWTKSSEIAQTL